MANDVAYPIPIGVTTSFANVAVGVNTSTFSILPDGPDKGSAGFFVVTFQPVDQNNPGTVTLVDGNGNTQLTMTSGGYAFLYAVASSGWYFTNTLGANILAITNPTGATR